MQASFLSEMFPPKLRYSGASLGYQIAAPLAAGTRPIGGRSHSRNERRNLGRLASNDWEIASVTIVAVLFAPETALTVANVRPVTTYD